MPGGLDVVPDDPALSAHELDAVQAVITTAMLGVATTGTVVLDHFVGQGRRALSLVPDLHVCVLRTSQVVDDVPAAVDRTAYRIVQESLTNIARHAAAATASVRIDYRPDALAIQVDDDGKNCSPSRFDPRARGDRNCSRHPVRCPNKLLCSGAPVRNIPAANRQRARNPTNPTPA